MLATEARELANKATNDTIDIYKDETLLAFENNKEYYIKEIDTRIRKTSQCLGKVIEITSGYTIKLSRDLNLRCINSKFLLEEIAKVYISFGFTVSESGGSVEIRW